VKPWRPLSLYVGYAEGLGFGAIAPTTAANAGAAFPPFVSRQVEVGAKLDLGTVGAGLALFEITRPSSFTDPVTRLFGVGGEQRNRGLELTVFGAPRPDVRVLGGVTFLDCVLTRTAGGQFDGKTAPGAPVVQLNLGGKYDLPLAPGLTTTARVIATSRQFYGQANTQSIPSWARLDLGARCRFEFERRVWTERFNVENVTGNNYWAGTGQGTLIPGVPRTYLFSLSADF
jgi:iron complex outermembrane recepter protein